LTFAAAQLPVGVLLDRYGPRQVQSALLLLAAGGAGPFGGAHAFVPLVLARALIGLGVSAALSSGFKALVLWFPKQRLALVNGCMIMLGALGAVTATAPAELLVGWMGWRGLFELLAAVAAGCALIVFFVVPDAEPIVPVHQGPAAASLKTIFADARFS